MPEITVAITTYNLEKYLESCFEELMSQTFQDFEILVYDDCSTDRTRDILAVQKKKLGGKLQVILGEIPQKRPSKARNAILDSGRITGKYVIFLDGDDGIEPGLLEHLYAAAEKSGADLALCAYDRLEDGTGRVLCREMRGYPGEILLGAQDSPSLAFINTSLWNKLIRTDRIGALRMPNFSVGEDASFLQEIYRRSKKIACVDQILVHYRVRSASVISNTPEDSIYCFARELHQLWQSTEDDWMKDNIALTALIHVGVSMPLRAYGNSQINIPKLLRWVRDYLGRDFHWFRGNRYLKFACLLRRGTKGLGIGCALICYKIHCFYLFLLAYKALTKVFGIDIKF